MDKNQALKNTEEKARAKGDNFLADAISERRTKLTGNKPINKDIP